MFLCFCCLFCFVLYMYVVHTLKLKMDLNFPLIIILVNPRRLETLGYGVQIAVSNPLWASQQLTLECNHMH